MTTPGQEAPDGAFIVGGDGEVDGWGQDVTEGYVTELAVPSLNPFDMLGSLAQALARLPLDALKLFAQFIPDAIEGAFNTIASAVNTIIGWLNPRKVFLLVEDFLEWVGSVFNVVTGALSAAASNAVQFIQQVIRAIIQGVRGIPVVGDSLANILEGLTGTVQAQQVQQQNFTITTLATSYRNPTWVCRYPIADAVYPEILNSQFSVFGATGAASAGTAHTHPIDSTADSGASMWAVNQNVSAGSYITVASPVVFDTVGTIVKRAGTVDNIFLEVFKEFPDGSLLRLFSADITSQVQLSETYVEETLTTPLVGQPGERYAVRVRNSSTTATAVSVVGLTETASMQEAGFFTSGSSLTTQTSYTSAEATTARGNTTVRRWFLLARVAETEVPLSFSDDFNRAPLGSMWVTESSGSDDLSIVSNRLSFTGTTNGDQNGIYANRPSTDANRVEANLHMADTATTQQMGLLMHCAPDFSQVVYLAVSKTGGAKIYSGSATSLTQRATHATGGEGRWSMYYDEGDDTYVALKDDVATGLQWSGASTAVTHGPGYRFGGARISRASSVNAGLIDNWVLRDWSE